MTSAMAHHAGLGGGAVPASNVLNFGRPVLGRTKHGLPNATSRKPRPVRRSPTIPPGTAFFWLLRPDASYLVVSLQDNKLGNRSERHISSPVRGHELNPAYRLSFDSNNIRILSDQGPRRAGKISLAKPDNVFRT
jgi:hypothetical protein